MKVAVINEVSARQKNPDIINALKTAGVDPINVGMTNGDNEVELTYIHTGLMAGILINLEVVDMVVGGCGTGQGFMLSAMQYPNVFCGLIIEPLDAWLFSQINGGNVISLALNKGYGWAADINLKYIFEKLFQDEAGKGYPKEREISQRQSRQTLQSISTLTHNGLLQILKSMDKDIINTIFKHKPFVEIIKGEAKNKELQKIIISEYLGG